MTEYIKREDAIKELRLSYHQMPVFKALREEWAIKVEGYRKAEHILLGLPPADVVEVVRCKDCKYVDTDATCFPVCGREGIGLKPYHVYDDDYCSYGERKDNE